MAILLLLILQYLACILSLQVSATSFCKCQNSQYGHKFTGIQQICKDLSNDWCSTKCNAFWSNCDYCQFKPAGQGPDADYERLKSWCFSQSDWDAASKRWFKGTEVNCYSRRNAQGKEWGNTGCDYEDNGDYPRDKRMFLRIKLASGWYQRRGCDNLMFTDWSELVKGTLQRNGDCFPINNGTATYTIECPYNPDGNVNDRRRADFKNTCERLKGSWYQRHDGPSLLAAKGEKDQASPYHHNLKSDDPKDEHSTGKEQSALQRCHEVDSDGAMARVVPGEGNVKITIMESQQAAGEEL